MRGSYKLNDLRGLPCIFCGGANIGTTVEHAPPKVLFLEKRRPKGLEFPCCSICNDGKRLQDIAVAMAAFAARAAIEPDRYNLATEKLIRSVGNNCREVIDYFLDSGPASAATVSVNGMDLETNLVPVNKQFIRKWLSPWAAKQSAALWYHHTGKILTDAQRVWVHWISPEILFELGPPQEFLDNLPDSGTLFAGKWSCQSQFSYRFNVNSDAGAGLFSVILHESIMFTAAILDLAVIDRRDLEMDYGYVFRFERSGAVRC